MRCIRQPQAPGLRPASGLLMVSFAGAGAERRVRRGPGRRVPTASPRREAAAAVAGAAVAARRRPAAAHVRRGAGGELQADEKAWCSSFRGVGVWVTGRCAGFGVTACVLLPRRIVFFGRLDGAVGRGRRSRERGGRAAERPPPRRLRGSVLYEVGFGEPCAAVLITPRREARSRSSQSLRCSTFRPPFKCRPKTGRRRSQGFYQQHVAVSSAEVVRSSRSRSARERASLDLRKLVRRGRNRADVRFRDQARPPHDDVRKRQVLLREHVVGCVVALADDGDEQRRRDARYATILEELPYGTRQPIWEYDVREALAKLR
jgi:hypothetical protein